jgi:hypothetical protein
MQLARTLDRQPLSQRHRDGSGQETGQAGEQDGVPLHLGAGNAHHQAEVGDQPVVRAQDRRPQGVAARRAMAALQPGESGAWQPGGGRAGDVAEDTRGGALLRRQAGFPRLGLPGVGR